MHTRRRRALLPRRRSPDGAPAPQHSARSPAAAQPGPTNASARTAPLGRSMRNRAPDSKRAGLPLHHRNARAPADVAGPTFIAPCDATPLLDQCPAKLLTSGLDWARRLRRGHQGPHGHPQRPQMVAPQCRTHTTTSGPKLKQTTCASNAIAHERKHKRPRHAPYHRAASLATPKPKTGALRTSATSTHTQDMQSRAWPPPNQVAVARGQDDRPIQQDCAGPNQMDLIKSASRPYTWHWSQDDKSTECLVSDDSLEVCFHPECSESAAAIRAAQPLPRNGNYYYWEITVFEKTYGTSMMFGLCTKQQSLHINQYYNLIGLDENGWSLSHKGLIWHKGKRSQYTDRFPEHEPITIGLLYNSLLGELSYFRGGKNLGVAFVGLNKVVEDLYPVIGSTAKCTRMRITASYCGFLSLLERSCFAMLEHTPDKKKLLDHLKQTNVPKVLIEFLSNVLQE